MELCSSDKLNVFSCQNNNCDLTTKLLPVHWLKQATYLRKLAIPLMLVRKKDAAAAKSFYATSAQCIETYNFVYEKKYL